MATRYRGKGKQWYYHNTKPPEDDPIIGSYYRDVSKEDIISAETERELFYRYKKHKDMEARDRIIGSALRFVVKLAKSYARDTNTTKDLISAGNVGLLVALERFDPKYNTRFLSYATSWVLLEMRNALYSAGVVSMPLWRQKAIGRMKQVHARSMAKTGEEADVEELSSEVDLSPSQIQRLQECQEVCVIALESPEELPETNTPNCGSVDALAMRHETKTLLRQLVRELPTVKEQFVIRAYFGLVTDALSLRQIACVLGVSSERVRQIKVDALRRLGKQLKFRLQLKTTHDFN